MYVTVTSIRLKKWWYFFRLSYHGMHIMRQTKSEKGFLLMKNTGFGLLHYTLSAWESEEDLKRFYRQGAHLEAIKKSPRIANETKTFTYQTDKFPGWKEAKMLLKENGKVLKWVYSLHMFTQQLRHFLLNFLCFDSSGISEVFV